MGMSTKGIAFFEPAIRLDVHTASNAEDLRDISIEEFAGSSKVRVEQVIESGELIVTRQVDGSFIHGAWVNPKQ